MSPVRFLVVPLLKKRELHKQCNSLFCYLPQFTPEIGLFFCIVPKIKRRIREKHKFVSKYDYYDTLHTESREAVANDVVEALKNWEREE